MIREIVVDGDELDVSSSELEAAEDLTEQGEPAPAKDDIAAAGEQQQGEAASPESKEVTPAKEEPAVEKPAEKAPVNDRALAALGYENRELRRQMKSVMAEIESLRKRDQEGVYVPRQNHGEYLEFLRDTDPDRYLEERLRVRDAELETRLTKPAGPRIEEDVNRNAAVTQELLNSVAQRIVTTCPNAVTADGMLDSEFMNGDGGFWREAQEEFQSHEQFMEAVINDPARISRIARIANKNIEHKRLLEKIAESDRKGRVMAQGSVGSPSKSSKSTKPLTPEEAKFAKQNGWTPEEFAAFDARSK